MASMVYQQICVLFVLNRPGKTISIKQHVVNFVIVRNRLSKQMPIRCGLSYPSPAPRAAGSQPFSAAGWELLSPGTFCPFSAGVAWAGDAAREAPRGGGRERPTPLEKQWVLLTFWGHCGGFSSESLLWFGLRTQCWVLLAGGAPPPLCLLCSHREGTNGVSTNGVTANVMFFDGLFGYSR